MSQPVKKDQVVIALDRLLEQFKDKPNIESILTTYISEVQDLEDTYFSLLNERGINTAVGNQLDILGALVNEQRLGRDDELYRIAILTRIGINNSEGTPNEIMSLLKNIENATKVKMWEHFPVSSIYYTNTEFTGNVCASESLQLMSPATSANVVVIYDPFEEAFAPYELVTEDYIITDEFGNFLITGKGNNLVIDSGDTLVFNTGDALLMTSGEDSLGDLITSSFYEDPTDALAQRAVLSEIIPDVLDVSTGVSNGAQAGEPFMQAGEPLAQAAPLFLIEGLLISSDGVSSEPLEIWSASELEFSEAPYGVLPEICVAGIENIIPEVDLNLLTVDSEDITVDNDSITADQTVLL